MPVGRPAAVAARTRVVDGEVARALGRGIDQIVLLGAGYDGRALRFGGRAVRWFEVDLPATQADKRRRLAALGIEPAGVDYAGGRPHGRRSGGALEDAGHDPAAPSLFVCEGVLASLTLEATAAVCETCAPGPLPASVLVACFAVAPAASGRRRALRRAADAVLAPSGTPRRRQFRPGDPEKLMVVTGWRVTHAEPSVREQARPRVVPARSSSASPVPSNAASGCRGCPVSVPAPDAAIARRQGRTGRSTAERTTRIPAPTTRATNNSTSQSESGMSQPRPANATPGPCGAHQYGAAQKSTATPRAYHPP